MKYYHSANPHWQDQNYTRAPISFATMRFSRQVERDLGCPYVSKVAAKIAAYYGLNDSEDGSTASFLAYAANCARTEAEKRRTQRKNFYEGFRSVSDITASMIGNRIEIRGIRANQSLFTGTVVDGPRGLGVRQLRKRNSYFPFAENQFLYRT